MKFSRIFEVLYIAVASAISGGALTFQTGSCCGFTPLAGSWMRKNVFLARPVFKFENQPKNTMLNQDCRVGEAELVAFLLQHTELWPLLCGARHCPGGQCSCDSARLVAASNTAKTVSDSR